MVASILGHLVYKHLKTTCRKVAEIFPEIDSTMKLGKKGEGEWKMSSWTLLAPITA